MGFNSGFKGLMATETSYKREIKVHPKTEYEGQEGE